MARRFGLLALLAAVILTVVATSAPTAYAEPTRAEGWTGWDCKVDVGVQVQNGWLSGQGCINWTDDSSFQWAVWASTSVSPSYAIYTDTYGYDQCVPNPFQLDMNTGATVYNTNYSTSNEAVGYYQNCSSGHNYEEFNANLSKATSSSQYEGGSAWFLP